MRERLDGQTAMGKAPVGVARLAKRYGKPVVAFAGGVTRDAKACNSEGITAYFSIVQGCSLSGRGDEERKRRSEYGRYGRTGIPSVYTEIGGIDR